MSETAKFDEHDHCVDEGWLPYQDRPMFRWRLRCALGRHRLPEPPAVRNGNSPSNFARCPRCRAFLKWFVPGQHRLGSLNRYFANLGRPTHPGEQP